ncbi:MAG: hypothetical protein ACOCS7_02525 [Halolamina sp.]
MPIALTRAANGLLAAVMIFAGGVFSTAGLELLTSASSTETALPGLAAVAYGTIATRKGVR